MARDEEITFQGTADLARDRFDVLALWDRLLLTPEVRAVLAPDLLARVETQRLAEGPHRLAVRVTRDPDVEAGRVRVFPRFEGTVRLDIGSVPGAETIDARTREQINELFGKIDLSLELSGNRIDIRRLSTSLAGAEVRAQGRVEDEGELVDLDLRIEGLRLDDPALLAALGPVGRRDPRGVLGGGPRRRARDPAQGPRGPVPLRGRGGPDRRDVRLRGQAHAGREDARGPAQARRLPLRRGALLRPRHRDAGRGPVRRHRGPPPRRAHPRARRRRALADRRADRVRALGRRRHRGEADDRGDADPRGRRPRGGRRGEHVRGLPRPLPPRRDRGPARPRHRQDAAPRPGGRGRALDVDLVGERFRYTPFPSSSRRWTRA